jgi:class 3 adenylate cyclase
MDDLTAFAPRLVLDGPPPRADGPPRAFEAAVLMVDISGFTPLAERLARTGPQGAETLSVLLDDVFGRLIDRVRGRGGDVVKFAGDALIAAWPFASADPAQATLQAVQCAVEARAELHGKTVAADTTLGLHMGIAAGSGSVLHLGGQDGTFRPLVGGPVMAAAEAASRRAAAGSIVLTAQAWARVRHACGGRPQGELVALEELRRLLPLPAAGRGSEAAAPPPWDPAPLLVQPLRCTLRAPHAAWSSELRRVTLLFAALPPGPPQALQRAVLAAQRLAARYEAEVLELHTGPESTVLIAALGLAPASHEDDPQRGLRLAMDLRQADAAFGATGVTTGHCFCGVVGNPARRVYTVIGDPVNLASRLMELADGRLLCDATTAHAARSGLRLESLPPVTVRGKADPVAVFRPLAPLPPQPAPAPVTPLVGRVAERARLERHLDALTHPEGSQGGALLIEGEAGIGKSRLLAECVQRARERGIPVLAGSGDAIERSSAYYAWGPVAAQLLELSSEASAEQRRARVLAALPQALAERAPLLNALLPLGLPETPLTAQMHGEVRGENTQTLLVTLLARHVRRAGPLLLVLEDGHWMDSASWSLALRVVREVPRVLLVIATRPPGDPPPAAYTSLLELPECERIALGELGRADIEALLRARLGVAEVPSALVDLVQERARGHPFFSEEVAASLLERDVVRVQGGRCVLTREPASLHRLDLPDTVQGVVTSRIDRLPPGQQLALKASSVIGLAFPMRLLSAIYPVVGDRPRLPFYLERLTHQGITALDTPTPDLAYRFRHVITQEVTYNLMLFAQRRSLHRAVAQWYEALAKDEPAPHYAALAYHWRHAGEVAKALDYLERAGEQALADHAPREATRFFTEALELAKGTPVHPVRRGGWHLRLANAAWALGELADCHGQVSEALSLLGWPLPAARWRLWLDALGQAARQLVRHLLRPGVERASDRGRGGRAGWWKERLRLGVDAFEQVTHLAYFGQDPVLLIDAGLRTVNLAEPAGPSPTLARAYASLAVSASLSPLSALARAYQRRARATAEAAGDDHSLAYVLKLGAMQALKSGRWREADADLGEALAIAERLDDGRRRDENLTQRWEARYYRGRFRESLADAQTVEADARRRGDVQARLWGLCGLTMGHLRLGELDAAQAHLAAAEELIDDEVERVERVWILGLAAVLRWRLDDRGTAAAAADAVDDLVAQSSPTAIATLEGYAGLVEVRLCQWQAALASPAAQQQALATARAAARACAALHAYARRFPIAAPRAWLWQGLCDHLQGHPRNARRAWHRALRLARTLHMPFEQALAHDHLGRYDPTARPAHAALHLHRARDLFLDLDATWDLARVEAALDRLVSTPRPSSR